MEIIEKEKVKEVPADYFCDKGINGNIRKVQRLFREEVHHKLMVMEMGDLNKMSEDIVSPSVVIQRSS